MKKFFKESSIDWSITVFPLVTILALAVFMILSPEKAASGIDFLRGLLVNDLGFAYMLFGLAVVGISLWVALSKYGNVQLGTLEKPRYSTFSWGAMIFTSTMAADILYWALIEWAYYFSERPFAMENMTLAEKQDWASAYPLFHWGVTPWAFYILPAAAYGYMMYVKKRPRQRMSEACRSVIGDRADGILGKVIDLFAVVGLLAATATTFSLTTPLLSAALAKVTGLQDSKGLSIFMLCLIAVVFMLAVWFGMKGISWLANSCVWLFIALLCVFFFFGPTRYIVETGVTAMGHMAQNFLSMSTWMDPLRLSGDGVSGFAQNWTIFYWAYWISWSVATPFFIGKISEGRTIRQTILGAYIAGVSATFMAFIIFGNFGLHQQVTGIADIAGMLSAGVSPSEAILVIFEALPLTKAALVLLLVCMVAFYASTFDALTMVIASYSLKNPKEGEEPGKKLRIFWSVVFILLPVALLFNESTLTLLQSLSICAAFPIMIILCVIIGGFLKDLKEQQTKDK
ncbi:MAG: BCCT family transporter [Oscillospiraceae bacterium]|nr:BCCT family transporter [Oscillospiraceae bacterium]